jgi:hypothetical protein
LVFRLATTRMSLSSLDQVLPIYMPVSRASSRTSSSSSCVSSCSSSSCSESSTSTSTSSSSDSSTSISLDNDTSFNLLDQLSTSPETRFHAAYMFLRYFNIISGGSLHYDCETKVTGQPECHGRATADNKCGNNEARLSEVVSAQEQVTWDVGVACLALSVKVGGVSFFYP